MSKYHTFDIRCVAWVEALGPMPGVYPHRCMVEGKEIEPRGIVLCFEHNLVLELDRQIKLATNLMLVVDHDA
jgi:predicted nucleic acid-binding Zn ribbon protein